MSLQFWAEFMVSRFFWIVPTVGTLAMWWFGQKYMDWSAGVQFGEVWDEVKNGNQAVAHYRGLRAIAVAVVVAGASIAGAITANIA